MTERQKLLLAKIARCEVVSARGDWMELVALADKNGPLTTLRAPNGQLEYLYQGKPVKVGP